MRVGLDLHRVWQFCVAVNDRGPFDGVFNYEDRFHVFDISVTPGVGGTLGTITPPSVDTRLLTNMSGQQLLSFSGAFDTVKPKECELPPTATCS